VANGILMDFLT